MNKIKNLNHRSSNTTDVILAIWQPSRLTCNWLKCASSPTPAEALSLGVGFGSLLFGLPGLPVGQLAVVTMNF